MQGFIGASELDISGGIYDTYDGQWLLAFSDMHRPQDVPFYSTLNIFGGQFGYANAGNGLFIDEWVNFSIFGRDLVYSNDVRRQLARHVFDSQCSRARHFRF